MSSLPQAASFPSGLHFVRSSKCSDAACVEVAFSDGMVVVRDGKDVSLPYLTFSQDDWNGFLDSLTSAENS
jgi:hypothetical protein